jgi:hypothetical protein
MEKDNQNQPKTSVKDINLEELKNFIASVQQSQKEEKVFKPERLQHLRQVNLSRRYTSKLSS